MKGIPGLDPPEYIAWAEEPALVREFGARAFAEPARAGVLEGLSEARRLALYRGLVRNRLHDIQLKRWVRSGVLSKAWLGVGEEAVTVGACHALEAGDAVGPMIRNAGAAHERGMPLEAMFRGALGTGDGPARGRDLHFGDLSLGVVAPISMVGSLVPVCAGVALAYRLRGEARVALTWAGDGTTATAGFHEGMASAAALGAPLVVVIQNNRIALGTPLPPGGAERLAAAGAVHGAPVFRVEGNNVLDVLAGVALARRAALAASAPALVVADTFRMGGHATHDEAEGRRLLPEALFEHYGRRDPVRMFRAFLSQGHEAGGARWEGVSAARLDAVEAGVEEEVRAAEARALESHRVARPDPASAAAGVFGN